MAKRVKEKRHIPHVKKKGFFRFYLVNILLALVIIACVIVLLSMTLFKISHVSVEGNTILDEQEIEDLVITGEYQDNGLYQWAMNLLQPKTDIPFVDSYKVSFKTPSNILIQVDEVDIYGFIALEDGSYAYFDGDGKVVEVSTRLVLGYLPVAGVTSESASVGEELPIKSRCLSVLLQLTKSFKKYEIPADVIYFEEDRLVSVQSNGILLDFGSFNYLEEKMMRLQYIMPHLEGANGTLHLENWTPENTDIIFEANDGSTEEVPAEEGSEENPEASVEETPVENPEVTVEKTTVENPEVTVEETTTENPEPSQETQNVE